MATNEVETCKATQLKHLLQRAYAVKNTIKQLLPHINEVTDTEKRHQSGSPKDGRALLRNDEHESKDSITEEGIPVKHTKLLMTEDTTTISGVQCETEKILQNKNSTATQNRLEGSGNTELVTESANLVDLEHNTDVNGVESSFVTRCEEMQTINSGIIKSTNANTGDFPSGETEVVADITDNGTRTLLQHEGLKTKPVLHSNLCPSDTGDRASAITRREDNTFIDPEIMMLIREVISGQLDNPIENLQSSGNKINPDIITNTSGIEAETDETPLIDEAELATEDHNVVDGLQHEHADSSVSDTDTEEGSDIVEETEDNTGNAPDRKKGSQKAAVNSKSSDSDTRDGEEEPDANNSANEIEAQDNQQSDDDTDTDSGTEAGYHYFFY